MQVAGPLRAPQLSPRQAGFVLTAVVAAPPVALGVFVAAVAADVSTLLMMLGVSFAAPVAVLGLQLTPGGVASSVILGPRAR